MSAEFMKARQEALSTPGIFRAPYRHRKDQIKIDPDFGKRLRALREARGFRQADFLPGRSPRNISLIERGQRGAITKELAGEIAKRCKMTVEELLNGGSGAVRF